MRQKEKLSYGEIRKGEKSYDGVSVLKEISLEIGDSEIVSILEPSGCGKTTIFLWPEK